MARTSQTTKGRQLELAGRKSQVRVKWEVNDGREGQQRAHLGTHLHLIQVQTAQPSLCPGPPPPGFYRPTFMLWRLSTRSPATELTEPLAVGRRPQVHLSTPRGRGAVPPHDEASVGGGGRC